MGQAAFAVISSTPTLEPGRFGTPTALRSDEIIKACAVKGGEIGVEAAPLTTISQKNPQHSLESFMVHYKYCVDLVGIDHLAFGPDVLFGEHVGLHYSLSEVLSIGASRGSLPYTKVEWVDSIENSTEAFSNIVRWMVKQGWSDYHIAKAIGDNVMRVLNEVWYR